MTTDDAVAPPQIHVSDRALTNAEAIALAASPCEVGGILVGWWEGGIVAVVHDFLTIPDHRAGHTHYERRHSVAQQFLDEYLGTGAGANAGYIGEWHSHPAPQPPSSIDRETLNGIVWQARHPVALVVLSMALDGAFQTHGLIGHPTWPRRAAIKPATIERMPS